MAKYSTLWLSYLCTFISLLHFLGQINPSTQRTLCTDNDYIRRNENGELKCIPCKTLPYCPHGLGVSISCGDVVSAETDIGCVECHPNKTFSDRYDNLPCKQCQSTLCHKNEEILGSCTVDNDTSTCGGVCEKGFYPRDGDLSHCQPCSKCLNNASILVKKCKDDGWPVEKQCEMMPVPSKDQGSLEPNGKRKNYNRNQGYEAYGHPLLLSSFVISIFILLILGCKGFIRMFRKQRQRAVNRQQEEVPMTNVNDTVIAPAADSGIHEIDSIDVSTDTTVVQSVRKRKSSTGSGGRKVSFSRQVSSNSNAGSDINDEDLLSLVAEDAVSGGMGVLQEQPSTKPERKRTLSQGSSGRRSRIFSRQNSYPLSGHHEEEEKTSLLSATDHNDNDIEPLIGTLDDEHKEDLLSPVAEDGVSEGMGVRQEQPSTKPERRRTLSQGSSGRPSRLFSRQNSNPIPEHHEEESFHKSSTFSNFSTILSSQKIGNKEEKTSLLSPTDHNDNDIEPHLVILPDEAKAPHRLTGLKIGDLNAETHRKLCDILNRDVPNDWEILAGRMGYTSAEVKIFAKDKNPADKLLTSWDVGESNDVAVLIKLAKEIQRSDVVQLLESYSHPKISFKDRVSLLQLFMHGSYITDKMNDL